jgi:hypothetical protein
MKAPIQSVSLIAHDAGGARALFPVADVLRERNIATHIIVSGPAAKIWREEAPHLRAVEVPDTVTVDAIADLLTNSNADIMLSASGGYNMMEHTCRLAARRVGTPIIALLDSWLNYAERFERTENGVTVQSLPDRVCAIDEWTREGLIAAGFDPSSVFVTGHPDLEKTVRDCRAGSEPEIRERRRAAMSSDDGLLIVFFSDPFYDLPDLKFYTGPGALMYPDGRPIFGYTVRDILPAVLQELDAAMLAENASCDLIVRPHPWEHDAALRMVLDETRLERVRVRLERGSSVTQWIQCADVLMGMMSIALLHAALGGKPSISVEIGLHETGLQDPCVSNNLGYTRGVFDRDSLNSVCHSIARKEWSNLKTEPKYLLPLDGAAERVADVALQYAAPAELAQACAGTNPES